MTDQPGETPTEPVGEGSATPPTPPPSSPAHASGASSYEFDADKAKAAFQGAHKFDLGIIAAGVIAWLAGFMPFYTVSVSVAGISRSDSASAYHGFFGWFGIWVALAAAVVVAAALIGVALPISAHQAALGLFGLALVCLIFTLFIFPGGDCGDIGAVGGALGGFKCDTGRGFGYWLAVLAVFAGGGLAFMRMRESTTSSHAA